MSKEIDDLLSDMTGGEVPVEAAPIEEAPPEEAAIVDPIQTLEPEAPAEPVAVPPVDPSPAAALAAPSEQEPPPIVDAPPAVEDPQHTIASLRQQLEEMAAKTLGVQIPVAPTEKPVESIAITPPPQVAPVEQGGIITFVENEEKFDEAMKTAEGFNRILTGVVQKSVETVLRNVPQMVVKLADTQITMRSAINEFYTKNEDLVQSKAYVGMVANELAAKNPDWTLDKLLGSLGGEVRGRLKMVVGGKAPAAPNSAPEARPGFVPKGGGGKPPSAPALTGQAKQIADLIS
jgi:hypothetical protein